MTLNGSFTWGYANQIDLSSCKTRVMLVSAFSSRDSIMAAYRHAIDAHYRLLSFGDAMLIL